MNPQAVTALGTRSAGMNARMVVALEDELELCQIGCYRQTAQFRSHYDYVIVAHNTSSMFILNGTDASGQFDYL